MGAYFSLRDEGTWGHTISETTEPSIWTNVAFSPLSRAEKLLLHRPGSLRFAFPGGLRQGDDTIQVSDVADISLLVGFEESAGRFYAGVLVHAAADNLPHSYSRAAEGLTLNSKGGELSVNSKAASRGDNSQAFSGMPSMQSLDGPQVSTHDTEFPYLLLYAVKEGVLAFTGQDFESCENVIREIAASYTETPLAAPQSKGGGCAPAPAAAAAQRVKCLHHHVGRAPPPVGRCLEQIITSDLNRRFAIRCDMEEQADCTNCATFALRVMLGLALSLRGYDIRKACEKRSDLGPLVGEAAGAAWEQLWRTVRR